MASWIHSQITSGWSSGSGWLSRFAPIAVAILMFIVMPAWLLQQSTIVPVYTLIGQSSLNADATSNGPGDDSSSYHGHSVTGAQASILKPAAIQAEAENKHPVDSEQLAALLLLVVPWAMLRLMFAQKPPGRASAFAGIGLPAVLRCRPRASAATLLGVFRL